MTSRQRVMVMVLVTFILLGNGINLYLGHHKAVRYIKGNYSIANAEYSGESVSIEAESILDSNGEKHDSEACELIHVNWATLKQLQELPGIGPVLAQRMIETREQAYFIDLEDLLRVPGIGQARLEQISSLICLALPNEED